MFMAAVFTLKPQRSATLPAYLGRATHAAFLKLVAAQDPELAQRLHEPNQERPFTVSDVWGEGVRRQGSSSFSPEKEYFLRITSISPTLSAFLQETLLAGPLPTLELAGLPFQVTGVTLDPSQNPWAGTATDAALLERVGLQPHFPSRVTLRFASPTVFRSQKAYMPLPLPRLVFEGLARRWNDYATIAIPSEVVRYAEECLVISRYRLQTERVSRGEKGAFPGFVGTCTFTMRVKDRYWMGAIHLLAHFAFYAGVGRQTAMGLGQVRVLE